MRNIEVKAVYPDLEKGVEAARAAGAELRGRLAQTDTYFKVRSGRLKLREIEGSGAELIAYEREDTAEARASDYDILPIGDAEAAKRALGRTLGIKVIVRKVRELWVWKHVRIHLDDVEHLGRYLEFEAVLGEGADEAEGRRDVEELMRRFGVRAEDVQTGSYADLLTRAARG